MTRDKMLKAVMFGLKKGQGKDLSGMAESVTMAIEMALEMEAEERTDKPLDFIPSPEIIPVREAPLPPPPDESAIIVGPDGGGIVNSADESVLSNPAPNFRHLSGASAGRTPVVTLEKLIEVLHSHTPDSIEFTVNHPEKGPKLVVLERNVISDPMAKSAQLIYKHPDLSDEMGVPSNAFLAGDPPPNLTEEIADIRRRAERLYAPRPRHIEPVPPPPSVLEAPPLNIREAMAESANAPDASSLSGMAFPEKFSLKR